MLERSSNLARWGMMILLIGLAAPHPTLLHSQPAADLYTAEHERNPRVEPFYQDRFQREAREQQEKFRKRIMLPDATGDNVPTLAALEKAKRTTPVAPATKNFGWQKIFFLALIGGAGVFFVRRKWRSSVRADGGDGL